MGSKYIWGVNPLQDLLIELISEGFDVTNKDVFSEINNVFSNYLKTTLNDENSVVHLDFKIIEKHGVITVVANNSVSALWSCGLLVNDVNHVLNKSVFISGNKEYKYNKKTGELKISKIK